MLAEARPVINEFAKVVEADPRTVRAIFERVAEQLMNLRKAPGSQTEPRHPFNREFSELLTQYVTATEAKPHRARSEFGAHLAAKLATPVPALRVKEWARQTKPRSAEQCTRVLDAARAVVTEARAGKLTEHVAMVSPEEVKKAMDDWLAKGFTRKALQLATELTPFVMGSWCRGEVSVPAVRFDAAMQKIRNWQTILEQAGELSAVPREEFVPAYVQARERGFTDADILETLNLAPFRLRCLLGKAEAAKPAVLTAAEFQKFKHVFLES